MGELSNTKNNLEGTKDKPKKIQHMLGVVGSEIYNSKTQEIKYKNKFLISEDTLQFLKMYEIKVDMERTIFKIGDMEYEYLYIKEEF